MVSWIDPFLLVQQKSCRLMVLEVLAVFKAQNKLNAVLGLVSVSVSANLHSNVLKTSLKRSVDNPFRTWSTSHFLSDPQPNIQQRNAIKLFGFYLAKISYDSECVCRCVFERNSQPQLVEENDLKRAKLKTRYINFETGRHLQMLCAGQCHVTKWRIKLLTKSMLGMVISGYKTARPVSKFINIQGNKNHLAIHSVS